MAEPAAPGLPPDAGGPAGRLHPAVLVAAAPLAVATALLLPAAALPAWLALLGLALRAGGPGPRHLARALRPLAPILLLIVLVHLLTTTGAAPLGRPSAAGLLRGVAAVGRLLAVAGAMALTARALPLPALVRGLSWWEPRRRPAASARLGVALTVAGGTVGRAVEEGRRIDAVVRLRRGGAGPGRRGEPGRQGPWERWGAWRPWRRGLDAAYLVVPLIESLLRRADLLALALQGRVPSPERGAPPPARQLALLLGWAAALAALALA